MKWFLNLFIFVMAALGYPKRISPTTIATPSQVITPNVPTMEPSNLTLRQQQIQKVLLEYMGKRCTLNPQIPPDVGCMEAVSFLLKQIGIDDGVEGIAGTAQGLSFFELHPEIFTEIFEPEPFAILDSATGTGNGNVEGHVAFFGMFDLAYPNDWGIVSNDSQTGLLREQWSWNTLPNSWNAWYTQHGGITPRMFRVN